MASSKNQKIAETLNEIAKLLEIKGAPYYKIRAYKKAAFALNNTEQDIKKIYKNQGLKGIEKISGIGKSIGQKIEEYLKKNKIKYFEDLKKETAIRQIVTHYFKTKGIELKQLKQSARQQQIIYSRYTKPAKDLLILAGDIEKAKQAINIVAEWANSRKLDYTIETVFKKWLELDRLKPKEIVKKPFYDNLPMVWSEMKKKWYVINNDGEWLEFAGNEKEIEWKIMK